MGIRELRVGSFTGLMHRPTLTGFVRRIEGLGYGSLWSLLVAMSLLGSEPTRAGDDPPGDTAAGSERRVEAPDVYARVSLLRAELDLLRLEMGRPESDSLHLEIRDAEPRQVFFQAITLFRKADRLCFEQLRERVDEPGTPSSDITQHDVLRVVDVALERILRVKRELAIEERIPALARDPQTTPPTPSVQS